MRLLETRISEAAAVVNGGRDRLSLTKVVLAGRCAKRRPEGNLEQRAASAANPKSAHPSRQLLLRTSGLKAALKS
jgi:hypothetical protein